MSATLASHSQCQNDNSSARPAVLSVNEQPVNPRAARPPTKVPAPLNETNGKSKESFRKKTQFS